MKRAMIDIETLSSFPDAAVISLGLVGFDDSTILHRETLAIGVEEWHGHIDPRTVKWWSEQEPAAVATSFRPERPCTAAFALLRLKEFAREFCKDECWANGPQFDLVILRSWWKRCANEDSFPVHYRTWRDCRTIWTLAKDKGIDLSPAWQLPGVAHDPGVDAERQATAVQLSLRGLR